MTPTFWRSDIETSCNNDKHKIMAMVFRYRAWEIRKPEFLYAVILFIRNYINKYIKNK